jgi:hypothetical protein
MPSLNKTWRCLEQRGFERLQVVLPDVGQRALVELASALARIVAPAFGFTPSPSTHYRRDASESEIGSMGDYTRTIEKFHGTPAAGVRFIQVEECSTDGAGPSCSGSTAKVTATGLPAGSAVEITVSSTPAPFRDAGLVVSVALAAPDEASLALAGELLDRLLSHGQLAE